MAEATGRADEKATYETRPDKPEDVPVAPVAAPAALPEINLGLDDLLAPAPWGGEREPAAPEAEAPGEDGHESESEEAGRDEPGEKADEEAFRHHDAPPEPAPAETIADAMPEVPDEVASPASDKRPKGPERLGSIFAPPPTEATEPDEPAAEQADAEAPREDDHEPAAPLDAAPLDEVEDLPPWHGAAQFSNEPVQEGASEQAEPEQEIPAATAEEAAAPEAAPSQPDRKVIGSYTIGPNSYTMYADGSVEALTPNGLYSFGSLDELRSFIEKGGPSPSGGR
jgi:hypothetical protein